MAKIKLTLPLGEVPVNGKQVTFVAPCDCSVADGIQIDGVDYDIVDSIGRTVSFRKGVWDVGAVLTVVLDATNHKAYLQNQNSYTKAETLTSATASLFGLGANAVPDNVFAKLSSLYLHCWAKKEFQVEGYPVSTPVEQGITNMTSSGAASTFYYSDRLGFDASGNVILVNPVTIQVSYNLYANANQLKGKFFYSTNSSDLDASKIYYCPSDAANATRTYWNNTRYIVYLVYSVAAYRTVYGEPEYLFSKNRNAYPDSGIQDGYEYQYLGVPFDNAVGAPKIATGSYVGTGTYGADNPNSLTFDFEPKMVAVVRSEPNNIDYWLLIAFYGLTKTYNGLARETNEIQLSWEGNTIKYYSTVASLPAYAQLNGQGEEYLYFAIG